MLPLNILSQFLPYNTNGGGKREAFANGGLHSEIADLGSATGIGWQLHPQAYVILACLLLVYLNSFSRGRLWTAFGFWITVPLTAWSTNPLSLGDIGANIGGLCMLLSVIAALLSVIETIRYSPAPAKSS